MSLLPNMDLYLPLAGFLFSLVLLLYSPAAYREAVSAPAAQEQAAAPEFSEESEIGEVDEISAEIGAFKEKIRQMQEMVAMRKDLHEKQVGEIISGINGIVGRLEQADPEKLSVLQPHLTKLVGELRDLRSSSRASSSRQQP
ncbi:MAG: hypothetical protein GX410_09060 [Elusimicrobia bacterium]|nr:hypothetical protein [Elusimicrobiota bacterium]